MCHVGELWQMVERASNSQMELGACRGSSRFHGTRIRTYDVWMTTTIRLAGPGPHGASFLMLAAADGKLPLAKTLIAKGVSPNTMAGGSTALDVACSSRNLDVAKFLLQKGRRSAVLLTAQMSR